MSPEPTPMFPLGTALLPGGMLPLHVFEPRYVAMMHDLLAADADPEFGQVLIARGHEVGGDDVRSTVGTIGKIIQLDALDGGRYALVALGTRRIRVVRWLDDHPYPRAEIEEWPDDIADLPDRAAIDTRAQRIARLLSMARSLGSPDKPGDDRAREDVPVPDVADDPVLATYHLATLAPVGPADRYRLLVAPGPADRLPLLDAILDDVEAMLDFRLS